MAEDVKFQNGQTYQKGDLIFVKKAKAFYRVEGDPKLAIMEHLDLVASDDGTKTQTIPGKGCINGMIDDMLFKLLDRSYVEKHKATPIKTHYLCASADNQAECLIKWAEQVIPLEVIVRNRADGSFSERYNVPIGRSFTRPTCEFSLKDDALHDPLINEDHIQALDLATDIELQHMREVALTVNQIMLGFFNEIGIDLIDFKLVFGRLSQNVFGDPTNLRLIGEISPDTCRLRDQKTGARLDKDIFRRDLSGLSEAYSTVLKKMLDKYRNEQRKLGVGYDNYATDEYGNLLK